jgi:hypothetical protein
VGIAVFRGSSFNRSSVPKILFHFSHPFLSGKMQRSYRAESGLHLFTNKGIHLSPRLYVPYTVRELASLLLSGIPPAPPFIDVRLPAHNRQQSTQQNRRWVFGEVIHFPRLFGFWHSFTQTASFSWVSCMCELMFNLEDTPTSLPFVVVPFVSFIAFYIERTSFIPKPVLDSFGGRLDCDIAA